MHFFWQQKKSLPKKILPIIAFVVIILYGGFLRLYALDESSFWIDEGFTLMQAEGIAHHGYPVLRSGLVEKKDVLMPYIIAPIVAVYGFEYPWLLRLPAALFGIGSILVAYLFAQRLFPQRQSVALLFSFFLSFSYWHIAWAQQVRGYSALIFFVLLTFYYLARHVQGNKRLDLFFTLAAAVGAITAKSFGIFLLPGLIYYSAVKKMYKTLLTLIVLSAIALWMMRHLVITAFNEKIVNYFSFYLAHYLWAYFALFLFLGISGIFVVFYIRERRVLHTVYALFVVTTLTVLSFIIFVAERRYALVVTPLLYLYASFFIVFMIHTIRGVWMRYTAFAVVLGGVLFYGGTLTNHFLFLPQKHYALEEYTPQPNFRKIYTAIFDDGGRDAVIISAYPHMNHIYSGNAGYAIQISLTGRAGDSTVTSTGREYYTGAQKIRGRGEKTAADKIRSLQKESSVYVILDELTVRRMDFELWDFVTEEGVRFIRDGKKHQITVYAFPQSTDEDS